MKSVLTKVGFTGAILALAVAAPVTFSAGSGAVGLNTACAETHCCEEIGSICGVLDHYKPHSYNNDDPCPSD